MLLKRDEQCDLQYHDWYFQCMDDSKTVQPRDLQDDPKHKDHKDGHNDGHDSRYEKACARTAEASKLRCKDEVEQWAPICQKTRLILLREEANAPDPKNTKVPKPTHTSNTAAWAQWPNITILSANMTATYTKPYLTLLKNGSLATSVNITTATMTSAVTITFTTNGAIVPTDPPEPDDKNTHVVLPGVPDRPPHGYCKPSVKELKYKYCSAIVRKLERQACDKDCDAWSERCQIRKERGYTLAGDELKQCDIVHENEKARCGPKKKDKHAAKHEKKQCLDVAEEQHAVCKAKIHDLFSGRLETDPKPDSKEEQMQLPKVPEEKTDKEACKAQRDEMRAHYCPGLKGKDKIEGKLRVEGGYWFRACNKLCDAWYEGCRAAGYQ
ncbi:hypothetical protein BDZ85DRAFT_257613 [Elsinoe ampelina]|uniref:Uncharacterized protein n=1 Tax=Elsinoe ampelina TaxID=302913 RepID=A0A6A6GIP0_9PEZI|nr:hypothetical protein BDZ85DRAFT_257613 [Elsinoe ampelina]